MNSAFMESFEENKLIGIMGTKNEGKHISLFFIKK